MHAGVSVVRESGRGRLVVVAVGDLTTDYLLLFFFFSFFSVALVGVSVFVVGDGKGSGQSLADCIRTGRLTTDNQCCQL